MAKCSVNLSDFMNPPASSSSTKTIRPNGKDKSDWVMLLLAQNSRCEVKMTSPFAKEV